MEQVQYQNYSTYHREEKRSTQRTSGYGDYEDNDTDLSLMYPQQKTFKTQTSFTPLQPDAIRAQQQQQTVRSQQTFQQESRLRDYQQQREEEIRRAEFVRQQELQQQEAFEQQQRQLREQQQRQVEEQRQRQLYEQQQRAREQQAREQQLREQRAREQQALEQQRAREQRAREQQALDQQRAREQRSREQQAREQQERLAAQQRQRYEQQQHTREAQTRQQSQAQLQARQYEQQRLAEQRKAQEAYEQQRQAQMRAQQQPQYYAQPQHTRHEMDHQKKLTSTSRVVPANLGSPTSQRRGNCPSWPPKNSSVRELPRTGFSPAFIQERGSKEFVWPPPKPEDMIVKEPIPHVHGHAGEAWHPQETAHVSRSAVPRSPTPTRRCGDAIWPPPHVLAAEASAHGRPSPQPVCRRGKFDDYITQNTISNVPPTYRVPPGTVHVVY